MKTTQTFRLCAALLAAAASSLQAQTPVRITADNVNLRAKPALTAEVVAQAHYHDQLAAFDLGEEWIGVAPPPAVDLWVSQDFVQSPDNTVRKRLNVRAGPSIDYNVVAVLDRGTALDLRGEQSGWLKIAPPANARLWVHRDFVEILSAAPEAVAAAPAAEPAAAEARPPRPRKPKAEETADSPAAPAEPGAVPLAPVASAVPHTGLPTPIVSPSVPVRDAPAREIPVPPPANLRLIPLEGQGRFAEFEGELRAAPLINEAPTRYRVVRWQNNRWQILCHVYGEAAKFRALQDKRVRVQGREYWIQGAAAPVLVPDQIREVGGE